MNPMFADKVDVCMANHADRAFQFIGFIRKPDGSIERELVKGPWYSKKEEAAEELMFLLRKHVAQVQRDPEPDRRQWDEELAISWEKTKAKCGI